MVPWQSIAPWTQNGRQAACRWNEVRRRRHDRSGRRPRPSSSAGVGVSTSLWSARLLQTAEAIEQLHYDYTPRARAAWPLRATRPAMRLRSDRPERRRNPALCAGRSSSPIRPRTLSPITPRTGAGMSTWSGPTAISHDGAEYRGDYGLTTRISSSSTGEGAVLASCGADFSPARRSPCSTKRAPWLHCSHASRARLDQLTSPDGIHTSHGNRDRMRAPRRRMWSPRRKLRQARDRGPRDKRTQGRLEQAGRRVSQFG